MKKKVLALICLPFILTSCGEGPSSGDGSSSISSDDSSQGTSEELVELFTPKVGEVRKWFDHGKSGESRFYNYCPTVFVENNSKHIYYCSNQIEGNVTDYVAYRRGTLVDNKMVYTSTENMSYLLGPTKDTWDSRHTCDPSVIKGEFKLGNETYSYLMAYLGCLTSDSTKNEVGIAYSKSPNGPWIKYDKNPIVPYDRENAAWGTGQPSLVSVDKKGTVCIFYTVGNKYATYSEVREYDLSDLNNPILKRTKKLPLYGLIGDAVINNADFAYDEENKKILMIKGRLPNGSDGKTPNFIADKLDVYYLDDSESKNKFDEVFKGNNAKDWIKLGTIDSSLTGFPRNHNSCFVTDAYGSLVEQDRIETCFSVSEYSDSIWGYLSTYRLYSTSIELKY